MPVAKKRPAKANSDRALVLTRIFNAPRSLVFAAWTEPQHLVRWSAPNGLTLPVSEGDLRPGGVWRACMRMADGTPLWLSGVYREIVPNERLVFTHAWEENGQRGHETLVTVRFAALGTKTKLTLRQSPFESVASREGHRSGWSECLDKLGGLLSSLRPKRTAPR